MRKITKKFKENALLVIIGVVLFWALFNYDIVFKILKTGYSVVKPAVFGAIIAFILNVPMSAIEKHLYKEPKGEKGKRLARKLKRPGSIILTFILVLGVIALVCSLIIPALISTVTQLADDLPIVVKNVSELLKDNKTLVNLLNELNLNQEEIVEKIVSWLKDGVVILKTLDSTVSFAAALFSSVVNFVIGIFFAVYMLAQKEKLKSQCKKICKAFMKDEHVKFLGKIFRRTVDTFAKFLTGQTAEAIILGSLCAVGMSVLGFPNAGIISILVACTALIPIVGAFIGAAIGFILICAESFKQAVLFVIFMVILQQIEGNLIYPRVVGSSVGLPPLWTLFSITVGGNMLGIVGMFLAVPAFSVIYCTLSEIVKYRNDKKAEHTVSEV